MKKEIRDITNDIIKEFEAVQHETDVDEAVQEFEMNTTYIHDIELDNASYHLVRTLRDALKNVLIATIE
jgi:hypothetical protein